MKNPCKFAGFVTSAAANNIQLSVPSCPFFRAHKRQMFALFPLDEVLAIGHFVVRKGAKELYYIGIPTQFSFHLAYFLVHPAPFYICPFSFIHARLFVFLFRSVKVSTAPPLLAMCSKFPSNHIFITHSIRREDSHGTSHLIEHSKRNLCSGATVRQWKQ